jgi:hypothetical protein
VVLREIKDGTDCSYPPPSDQMVTLQEVGELQGKRHALFDWVPGVTLRDTLHAMAEARNPIPLGLIGRVVIDACRALDAVNPSRAHGGINDGALQIGFDGKVWVLDWGAPRQTRFRPLGRVNFSADVFAMGGVVHACLTGFEGEYATASSTLPGPSLSHTEASPTLDDVVMRALSPQPDQRQRDVGTFADELEAVLAEVVFTHDQVSTVVQTLFKERIKLFQSLGGLIRSPSGPDLETELPLAGVPMGTQPGIGGPLSIQLDGEAGPEHQSEPTLPRVDSKELIPVSRPPPRSVVPWDSDPSMPPLESAEPTQPRMVASAAVRAAQVNAPPGLPDPHERTASVTVAAQDKPRSSSPRGKPAPPPSAASLETDPGVRDEDTAPRARPALLNEDTSPRARPSRLNGQAVEEPLSPRNTTEQERLRARGQERIPTPPPGATPAALNEPTNVKPRPKPPRDPQQFAQTAQTLAPVMDGDGPDESTEGNGSRGNGLKWMIRVMALLVAALMVGVVVKVKQQQQQKEEEPVVAEVEDAGLALEPEDAGSAALAGAELDDAGLDAGADDDAGVDDAGAPDAGEVDAGRPDAGIADAGVAPKKKPPVKKPPVKKPPVKKPPVKKPPKKKKRRGVI